MMLHVADFNEFSALFEALDQFIQNTEDIEDEITQGQLDVLDAARRMRYRLILARSLAAEV